MHGNESLSFRAADRICNFQYFFLSFFSLDVKPFLSFYIIIPSRVSQIIFDGVQHYNFCFLAFASSNLRRLRSFSTYMHSSQPFLPWVLYAQIEDLEEE